jgi:uncharacterized phage-like protein YoqJ
MLFVDQHVVAFTGHRPEELGGYGAENPIRNALKLRLKEEILRLKPVAAISGMALGVDQWAAEVCVELRIPFTAAVPFEGQESVWPEESQRQYRELIAKAYRVHVVCEGGYVPYKMQARNEWMVDHCSVLIQVWNGTRGGTANCIMYADSIAKPRVWIDPRLLKVA